MGLRMREYRPCVTRLFAWGAMEKELPSWRRASVRSARAGNRRTSPAMRSGLQGGCANSQTRIAIPTSGTTMTRITPRFSFIDCFRKNRSVLAVTLRWNSMESLFVLLTIYSDDYFSAGVPLFQIPNSRRDLTQAVTPVNDRRYFSGLHEVVHDGQVRSAQFSKNHDLLLADEP